MKIAIILCFVVWAVCVIDGKDAGTYELVKISSYNMNRIHVLLAHYLSRCG